MQTLNAFSKTTILRYLPEFPTGITDYYSRRISLASKRYATLISAYAHTLTASVEAKGTFYETLDRIFQAIPRKDKILLLGKLNSRMEWYHILWKEIIGKYGIGKINKKGQQPRKLCTTHNLTITNTFFRLPDKYKTSWIYHHSKY